MSWAVTVPIAWTLIHLTSLGLLQVYFMVTAAEIIKLTIGLTLLHKGVWVNNIVVKKTAA